MARFVPALLEWKPLRWIGLRSYGIYLWHWPIFMTTRPMVDVPIDGDAKKIVSLDPWGHVATEAFADAIAAGWDVRPTIAVTRRETNGWKWPGFMLLYLFSLAYIFAGITYWSAVALGERTACGIQTGGSLWCWGQNWYGWI